MLSCLMEEVFHLEEDCELLLLYRGLLSEAILLDLGDVLRGELILRQTEESAIRRIFSVFVEQTQNMLRYSAERARKPDTEKPRGMIAIGAMGGNVSILCENWVEAEEAKKLRDRLERLNALDKTELRAIYREQMKNGPVELTNRAGLGLLEIARRASRPIEYALKEANGNLCRFFMKVHL